MDIFICVRSRCRFADYVKVLQCYRCLSFGHFAKDCKRGSFCGHCAGIHATRDCMNRDLEAKCHNCSQGTAASANLSHSALDPNKCPILRRKIMEKTHNINYG